MTRRVVITGIGAVTPLGNSFHAGWTAAVNGISGIATLSRFDTSGFPWKAAGEVTGFNAHSYLLPKELLHLDHFIHYAAAAASMALEDAQLIPAPSAGIIIGSSRGGIGTLEREMVKMQSGRRPSPYLMPASTVSMAASFIAQKLGIRGHCLGISNACASGANAIGEAFRMIKHGGAAVMLAGGAEAPLCRIGVGGYGAAGALSRSAGASASRPFDRKRDGFVLAEGASVLVLEEYATAMERSAPVYAEVSGYGNTTDAFHLTQPAAEGEARALALALAEALIRPEEVDYISTHGTSTVIGDKTEAAALHAVFKSRASVIPAGALKSMTGHMLAASGAFEIACAAMSIKERVIPPTINLDEKDPECDINIVRGKKALPVQVAVSNSFGFGGVNAVLVLKAVEN